jgi:hypothetical protein
MAKPGLQNISTTNTFQTWLDRTNEIVDIIKGEVVTASVIGDVTGSTGVPLTATLIGSFTANTITASTTLRADSILPRIGSVDIAIGAPVRVNTSTQVGITLTNSSGPRTVFNSGSVEWRVGFENTSTNNFIIDTGLGARKVSITPFGNMTIPGTLTALSGIVGNITGNLTGNSSSATILQTGRTIGITGDVVYTSPSFNGSEDVTDVSVIQPNVITNAKLRDSIALSVIGRSANSTGDPGDIAAATDHQVLRRSGTSIGFGAIALNQTAAITGVLPVSNGGTGADSFTTGRVLFGSGNNPIETSANLFWSNTNNRLGINQPAPAFTLDVVGIINATGSIRSTGDITAFSSTSDLRKKENVHRIQDALEKVSSIGGYTFNFKGNEERLTGVIAQEIEKVLPEVVYEVVDENTGETTKAVRYGNIVGLLIEAIKDLKNELDHLKNGN